VDHAANSQRLAGDGGDWRAVVVQLAIIVFGVFFYLPFLKIAERVALKNSGIEN
jgi:PTS system cellobiose-specific IIC component